MVNVFYNKALSTFYKNPSNLSWIKTIAENLKYLRWSKGLSLVKGAKAIGVSLFTIIKLENRIFRKEDFHKIDFKLLKEIYSLEMSDLCNPRKFICAVNFEFMNNDYLDKKNIQNDY